MFPAPWSQELIKEEGRNNYIPTSEGKYHKSGGRKGYCVLEALVCQKG
jgi:hypothetical protein